MTVGWIYVVAVLVSCWIVVGWIDSREQDAQRREDERWN